MSEQTSADQQTESVLEALVGEGKKYANLEELAKSRIEADKFIDTLKEENAELRGTAQKASTINDVLDALKQNKDTHEAETPLDDDVLQQKITDLIEQRDAERTRKANRSEAEKLVQSKIDGDISDFIKEKATQLSLSEAQLWSLSEESPQGFANLVGLGNQRPASSGSTASLPHQNTDAIVGGPVMEIDGHKTKAYYDKARKEMGTKKFLNDRSMQRDMLNAALALGDKFNS